MSTDKFQKVVDQYIEAFDKADINLIKDMYADDATVEDPVGSEVKVGIDAICEFYNNAFAGGAKLELNGKIRAAGNSVAFPFTVVVGDMRISPIDVFELNDEGKVISMKAYWGADNLG